MSDQYVLALWQKAALPLKVGAMIFFSLPFAFGPAREANPGRRVTLGAIVGISYYYFDQALGYTGLLLGLHPAFTTLLPSCNHHPDGQLASIKGALATCRTIWAEAKT